MKNPNDLPRWQLAIAREVFDEEYYLQRNEDVRLAGVDAFEHFMAYGSQEGRDPCPGLDMRGYLDAHPEIGTTQVHPFIHYLTRGLLEPSVVSRPLPENVRAFEASAPNVGRLPSSDDRSGFLEPAQIRQMLAEELGRRSQAVLALSHTQYVTVTGGTENVITAEAAAMLHAGWCYFHVCPLAPIAAFLEDDDAPWGQALVLTINGQKRGNVHAASLALAMKEARSKLALSVHLVIHHLIGFELGSVLTIARACGSHPATMWVHDFFTLCIDPFLMRNNVQFCAAPPGDSTACTVCSKGRARRVHVDRMRRLFKVLRPHVIAPSATLLELWRKRNDYEVSDIAVVPVATLALGKLIPAGLHQERPLRVAYLGPAVWLKGWLTFQKLVNLLLGDARYQFYRFGYGTSGQEGVKEVDVRVTSDDPLAMVRAISTHEIDVVLNWSACYESFSFVTCEALAAGASVVARAGAGNVPHLIASVDAARGHILRTEVELLAFFVSGKAMSLKDRRLDTGYIQRTPATALRLLDHEIT